MPPLKPLLWLNVVGLTPRLLRHAPNLRAVAERGSSAPLGGIIPAVTCSAQATALTGLAPSGHGIVGNGWFHRTTGEVRFWLQSNALLQGETLYAAARRLAAERSPAGSPAGGAAAGTDAAFTCAKLFWWFNQGAPVDWSVTPKPWYGAAGSKVFGIQSDPPALAPALEAELGPFPFHSFWGPMAGLPSSDWIAHCAAHVLRTQRPTLSLVYLPHLDYDLQRHGPDMPGVEARVAEVDRAAGVVIAAARETDTQVLAFSEYGILPVRRAVLPNRVLREAGLLVVRDGPFGETIDTFRSRAFAVCDHQLAHVYVRAEADRERVATLLESLEGVGRVLGQRAKIAIGLEHPRAGDLVLQARPDAWFAYPYWLDERHAPDFARTVDIHRKPGYDPLELFLDPTLRWPKLRLANRLLQKKLGLRYLMDVVPLDTALVKGSHGLLPVNPEDGAVFVSDDPEATSTVRTIADLKEYSLHRMGLT